MSEATTMVGAGVPASEGAAPVASEGAAAPVDAPDAGLSMDDVAALSAADSGGGEETVALGEHEIPLSVLEAAMSDEKLMRRLKRTLRVDGQDVEVSLMDALDRYPLAAGAQKRMWEAAQQRKQVEQLIGAMKSDPLGVMERVLGGSEAIYKAVADRLEYEGMSPEDRARLDEERDLRQRAARADEYERAEQERTASAKQERLQKTYAEGIRGAIEGAGLRVSKHAIQRTAMVLDQAMRDGIVGEDIAPADYQWAARQVAAEIEEERASLIPEDAEGDALIESVGEARARRIAQAYAARVRAKQQPVRREPNPDGSPASPRRSSGKPGAESWDDFFARKNREMGIG